MDGENTNCVFSRRGNAFCRVCPDDTRSAPACVAVPRHGGQHELCAAQEPDRLLDVQEIDTVYGWRGGRYFIENVRAWERIETVAATNALCGVIDIHLENDAELVPRRFTATCGGEAAFTQFATPPPWLFRSDWTLMKVTRRGVGVPSEWIRCDVRHNSFALKVR